jgi:hypothetical protein
MRPVHLTGACWISGGAWGGLRHGGPPGFVPGKAPLPALEGAFPKPLARWGRFDDFTRLGCAAAGLALKDAGFSALQEPGTGMVVGSRYETLRTDREFNASSLPEGGMLASPNLFSYTLPVIVLGECAAGFNLTGPAFCVGEEGGQGLQALRAALLMLDSGKARRMIAGWIESPPGDQAAGAVCAILEMEPADLARSAGLLTGPAPHFRPQGGGERLVRSLSDLF